MQKRDVSDDEMEALILECLQTRNNIQRDELMNIIYNDKQVHTGNFNMQLDKLVKQERLNLHGTRNDYVSRGVYFVEGRNQPLASPVLVDRLEDKNTVTAPTINPKEYTLKKIKKGINWIWGVIWIIILGVIGSLIAEYIGGKYKH